MAFQPAEIEDKRKVPGAGPTPCKGTTLDLFTSASFARAIHPALQLPLRTPAPVRPVPSLSHQPIHPKSHPAHHHLHQISQPLVHKITSHNTTNMFVYHHTSHLGRAEGLRPAFIHRCCKQQSRAPRPGQLTLLACRGTLDVRFVPFAWFITSLLDLWRVWREFNPLLVVDLHLRYATRSAHQYGKRLKLTC